VPWLALTADRAYLTVRSQPVRSICSLVGRAGGWDTNHRRVDATELESFSNLLQPCPPSPRESRNSDLSMRVLSAPWSKPAVHKKYAIVYAWSTCSQPATYGSSPSESSAPRRRSPCLRFEGRQGCAMLHLRKSSMHEVLLRLNPKARARGSRASTGRNRLL
jgi:hypothetical protein